jgi:hypothetical protein
MGDAMLGRFGDPYRHRTTIGTCATAMQRKARCAPSPMPSNQKTSL